MRVTSYKTLMCNKLCNFLFSELLAKRPALDACCTLDGTGALAGIRASRHWTVAAVWTGKGCSDSGRYSLFWIRFLLSVWRMSIYQHSPKFCTLRCDVVLEKFRAYKRGSNQLERKFDAMVGARIGGFSERPCGVAHIRRSPRIWKWCAFIQRNTVCTGAGWPKI